MIILMKRLIKKLLVYSPIRYSERLVSLWRLTLLRDWITMRQPIPYFNTRELLYAYVVEKIGGNKPISYLEFGVEQGNSIKHWSKLNTNDQSEFIGFDSFEGLPEDWVKAECVIKRGHCSTDGIPPKISDKRVTFIKGWFNDTLPPFLEKYSTDKQLVIHCDADLYTSTLFVLCTLHPFIKTGVIILFDDFSAMSHDFSALEDYTRSFRRNYEVLGAAGYYYYGHVAIKVVE